MNETHLPEGSDRRNLSRRDFVKTVGTAAVAASVPLFGTPARRPPGGSEPDLARRRGRRPLLQDCSRTTSAS